MANVSKFGLWRHLRESPLTPPDDLATLFDILNRADFITPYRLMEHVLSGPMQGRRRLYARLGREARDPIEEGQHFAETLYRRMLTPP